MVEAGLCCIPYVHFVVSVEFCLAFYSVFLLLKFSCDFGGVIWCQGASGLEILLSLLVRSQHLVTVTFAMSEGIMGHQTIH